MAFPEGFTQPNTSVCRKMGKVLRYEQKLRHRRWPSRMTSIRHLAETGVDRLYHPADPYITPVSGARVIFPERSR